MGQEPYCTASYHCSPNKNRTIPALNQSEIDRCGTRRGSSKTLFETRFWCEQVHKITYKVICFAAPAPQNAVDFDIGMNAPLGISFSHHPSVIYVLNNYADETLFFPNKKSPLFGSFYQNLVTPLQQHEKISFLRICNYQKFPSAQLAHFYLSLPIANTL